MSTSHITSKSPPEVAHRLRMTYEEFLAWADEDVHAEWVDGEVIVFMPPRTRHQAVVYFLTRLLGAYVDFFHLGRLLFAPFEMRLSSSAREPDILFVSQANLHRLTAERLDGPADLIVEVVSEDSVRRDRVQKFIEYQSAGVREYWLVDSQPEVQPEFYFLNDEGRFEPAPIEEGLFRSRVLPGLWLKTEWLTASEMLDPLTTFADIVGVPEEVKEALRRIAEEGPRIPE